VSIGAPDAMMDSPIADFKIEVANADKSRTLLGRCHCSSVIQQEQANNSSTGAGLECGS
jgi:hypothetical protein